MTQMVSAALTVVSAQMRATDAPALSVGPDGDESVHDPSDSRPAFLHGLRPFVRGWPVHPTAVRLARVHARTWLTMSGWPGDRDEALQVVHEIVDNAVLHPVDVLDDGMVELALSLSEDGDLVIEVTDPDPRFPGFTDAVNAGPDTGLGRVRALGGEIAWGTPDAEHGKSVRVRLRPSPPFRA
ncbi:ATP-binding protein [Streptomyces sp. NPDC047072]|uniref:ATP-binding protein n=1 Tax=Streptomyces sp. NPDC047072 TaxID=3154809 RepID=UPI0033C17CAF